VFRSGGNKGRKVSFSPVGAVSLRENEFASVIKEGVERTFFQSLTLSRTACRDGIGGTHIILFGKVVSGELPKIALS